MQENCHLRFLIFELSSQRFFDLKLAIFRFFKNSKKHKFWRFWPQNCGRFLNTLIKVNRWKTLLGPCTLKLLLSIFFVGRFVLAQFWAITLIISWSVKKLDFCDEMIKNDHLWSFSDHRWKSSFWVPDQSVGVHNVALGWAKKMDRKKKQKNHYWGPNFAVQKRQFFFFFENLQIYRFWSANFSLKTAPTEKTEYTTTTVTENARKLSSPNFNFQTFVTETFWFKVSHFSFFKKFQKTQFFTNLAIKLRMHPEHLDQS